MFINLAVLSTKSNFRWALRQRGGYPLLAVLQPNKVIHVFANYVILEMVGGNVDRVILVVET